MSKIALENLHRPIQEGGLNLDFSPSRPTWAKITDLIIDASMPQGPNTRMRINCFLQTWDPPQRGERASKIDEDTTRMLRAAQKYNVNLAAIKLKPHLKAQLPAWHHLGTETRTTNNNPTKCLIHRHEAKTVADLLKISARLRTQDQEIPHRPSIYCECRDRIDKIFPKLNPLFEDNHHGNLSLTPNRKLRNDTAREENEEILFDPSITSKNNLAECFRVFTDPERLSKDPAQRRVTEGPNRRHEKVEIYTDGAPGEHHSNQIGELIATIAAIQAIPHFVP